MIKKLLYFKFKVRDAEVIFHNQHNINIIGFRLGSDIASEKKEAVYFAGRPRKMIYAQ